MNTSSETLERAIRDGIVDDHEPVTFFASGDELHGSLDCYQWCETVTMGILRAVIQPAPRWCDCRGFHATRAGRLLTFAETLYASIDQDAAGAEETTWGGIHQRLRHTEQRLTDDTADLVGHDTANRAALDELIRRAARASEAISHRSRRHLRLDELHRAFAAQAIEVLITAANAPTFARWAREQRINETRSRNLTGVVYDRILDQAISVSRTVTAVIADNRQPSDSTTIGNAGLPAELELLIWWHQQTGDRHAIIDVPEIVANGMAAVLANRNRGRVGIYRGPDLPRETLEEAIVLWTDPGSAYVELDDAVTTVSNL